MYETLNEYKESTMQLCRMKGWDTASVEFVWLLLTEEIGELAGSIRRNNNYYKDKKKIKIEDELGDVFSYLFQIAGILDIDLNEMWKKNQFKSINKRYFNNNKHDTRSTRYPKYASNRTKIRDVVYTETNHDNSE